MGSTVNVQFVNGGTRSQALMSSVQVLKESQLQQRMIVLSCLQRILNDFIEDQAFSRAYDLAPLPSVSLTSDTQEV
jgi:hypothetical protein